MSVFIQPPFWAQGRPDVPPHIGESRLVAPTVEPLTIAEVKKQLLLNTTAGEPAPAAAPLVALPGTPVAGAVDAGAWRIGYTFLTADGETELGPLSAPVTIVDPAVNGQIAVSGIALGGNAVTARKAYAVPPSGGNPKYAATLNDNTSTTQTINLAAAALGAEVSLVNTTLDPELLDLITAARVFVEAYTGLALLPQTWRETRDVAPLTRRVVTLRRRPVQLAPIAPIITYVDASGVGQTLDPATYQVDAPQGDYPEAARILPVVGTYAWPFSSIIPVLNGFTVDYVAGWPTPALVPAALKRAMRLLIGLWHGNREAGELIRASADVLPFGVTDLLAPFTKVVVV